MNKGFYIFIVLVLVLLTGFFTIYSIAGDKDTSQRMPHYTPTGSKPILPPAIPNPSPNISPTISPHIASPLEPHMAVPSISTHMGLPDIPMIGNVIGKVEDIGVKEDGSKWIEVQDEVFGDVVKVKVFNVPVTKQGLVLNFEDIKKGDVLNVMFVNEGDENNANLIMVLTEEEMKHIDKQEDIDLEEPSEEIDQSGTEISVESINDKEVKP